MAAQLEPVFRAPLGCAGSRRGALAWYWAGQALCSILSSSVTVIPDAGLSVVPPSACAQPSSPGLWPSLWGRRRRKAQSSLARRAAGSRSPQASAARGTIDSEELIQGLAPNGGIARFWLRSAFRAAPRRQSRSPLMKVGRRIRTRRSTPNRLVLGGPAARARHPAHERRQCQRALDCGGGRWRPVHRLSSEAITSRGVTYVRPIDRRGEPRGASFKTVASRAALSRPHSSYCA
jgi:hypothetical protein